MALYFKLAPGVRVRVGKHGVRTSLGPRAARVHVGGGYRAGISTGAGPVTLYHGIGGTRRRRSGSATPSTGSGSPTGRAPGAASRSAMTAAAKSAEAQQITAALQALTGQHRHPVDQVSAPVAPSPPPIDEDAVRHRRLQDAHHGVAFWHRADRKAAVEQAEAAAAAEIATLRAEAEAERQQLQAGLDQRWAELLANDADVVLATLAEAFEDNDVHAAPVAVDGAEVSVVVFVPGTDVVPDRLPSTTPAGNLTLKKMTQTQAAGVYAAAVCGQVLAAVKEALAVAPGLASVRAAAVRVGPRDAYGQARPECLLAATFSRSALHGVEWEHTEAPAVFDQLAQHVSVNLAGRVKHLEPIDLSTEPELAALIGVIDVDR